MANPLTTQQVPKTDIQFNSTDPAQIAASLRRLVTDIQAIESATNALIAAQSASNSSGSFNPPYTLATTTGLGSTNKVSGLTAGLVLRAISATNAAFQKLGFGDLALSDIVNPMNGQIIQFVDGFWTNVTASLGGGVVGNNLGTGSQIYAGVSGAGSVLNFRSLTSGAGVTLSVSANSIEIDLNYTTVTGLLLPFTTTAQGVVPPPGAINGFFLGDDGNWHQVPKPQLMLSAGWNISSGVLPVSFTVPQDVEIPYACTLQEVRIQPILASGFASGSCVVTLGASAFPVTSPTDITGGVPPAISAGTSYANSTLTGWTTAFTQGEMIRATLTSNSGFQQVKIFMRFQ